MGEWIGELEDQGILKESRPWSPWFANTSSTSPAGYVTEYAVNGSVQTLSFATIRLAGHMVPQFQPEAALAMISRWLAQRPLMSITPREVPDDFNSLDYTTLFM